MKKARLVYEGTHRKWALREDNVTDEQLGVTVDPNTLHRLDEDQRQLARICEYLNEHFLEELKGANVDAAVRRLLDELRDRRMSKTEGAGPAKPAESTPSTDLEERVASLERAVTRLDALVRMRSQDAGQGDDPVQKVQAATDRLQRLQEQAQRLTRGVQGFQGRLTEEAAGASVSQLQEQLRAHAQAAQQGLARKGEQEGIPLPRKVGDPDE